MSYNGYPFDESLVKVLNGVGHRIKINKAGMIIIDGGVGEGKTTLACHIAEYYQPGWVENRSKELLAMGGTEFTKALDTAVKQGDKVIVYDEAGDFSSRTALTYFNQNINRIFETYRQTRKLIILCLPQFDDVDKSIFKKQIPRILIHVHGRGKSDGKYSVYSLWRTWYLREKAKKITVPTDCFSMVKPNLRGKFKDLSPEKAKMISEISIKGKKRIIRESYLLQKGLIDIDQIVTRTGYSRATIYSKLKGITCETVGKKKYFNKDVLEGLVSRNK